MSNPIYFMTDWKEKSVMEYTDNDFEMLYEEWEENDEEKLPPDELPYGHPDRLVLVLRKYKLSYCSADPGPADHSS